MKKIILAAVLLLGIIFLLRPAPENNIKTKPIVVVTFSILEDLVKNVCGDKYEVIAIVGRNSDAHVYRPKPMTSKLIASADLIIINGLGFEGWMDRLISSTGYKGKIVTATRGITSPGGQLDPHAWNDVANVERYVENIAQAFIAQDPKNAQYYTANKVNYQKQLRALDTEIRSALQNVPRQKRKFVTAHDAFQYFERAYKVEVLSPVGVSTEQEASAKDVVRLINQIRSAGIKTIFAENITNEKLIRQIAKETGATLGGTLYTDALSLPHEPAPTYLKLMRHNFALIYASMTSLPGL